MIIKRWNEDGNTALEEESDKRKMRQPGIEPGPLPWKGRILTIRPLTLCWNRLTYCLTHPMTKGKAKNESQLVQRLSPLDYSPAHQWSHSEYSSNDLINSRV